MEKGVVVFLVEPNYSPAGWMYSLTGKWTEALSEYLQENNLDFEWSFDPFFIPLSRGFDWNLYINEMKKYRMTDKKFERSIFALLNCKFSLIHFIVFSKHDFGGRMLEHISFTHGKTCRHYPAFCWRFHFFKKASSEWLWKCQVLSPASHESTHLVLKLLRGSDPKDWIEPLDSPREYKVWKDSRGEEWNMPVIR